MTVVCIDRKPAILPDKPGMPEKVWVSDKVKVISLEDLPSIGFRRFPIDGDGAEDIWASEIGKDGKAGVYLFNSSNKVFRGCVADSYQVTLYPRTGLLIEDLNCAQVGSPVPLSRQSFSVDSFRLSFPENQCPLHVWHKMSPQLVDDLHKRVARDASKMFTIYPTIDLLAPRTPEILDGETTYYARFLACGDIRKLRMVIEPIEGFGLAEVSVNGKRVTDFVRSSDYDLYNYSADISEYIDTGNVSMLNVVAVRLPAGATSLDDSPILAGDFVVSFAHGLSGLPTITAHSGIYEDARAVSWTTLGRMYYSGFADYEFTLQVDGDQSGTECLIDLGEVETLAAVYVDGDLRQSCFYPPYKCSLGGLSDGEHNVRIRVTNTLANRIRGQWRNSGLLSRVAVHFMEAGVLTPDFGRKDDGVNR